jgi:hypothetical protein
MMESITENIPPRTFFLGAMILETEGDGRSKMVRSKVEKAG